MGDNLPEPQARAGVIYRHSVEAVLNVVRRRSLMTTQELAAYGLEKARDVDMPTWERLLRALAHKVKPGVTEDEGLELLGAASLEAFAESFVGRSLFLVLRLMGPRRAMLRMGENFRTADSVTDVVARAHGERHVELDFSSVGNMPTNVRGLLGQAMVMLGVKSFEVTFTALANGHTRYDVKW